MNDITRLIEIVNNMETGVSPQLFSEFSDLLARVGSRHNDNPAAKKLINLIFTSAQYLGIEAPDTRHQVHNALQTMCHGLFDLSQDPGMASDASGQAFSQGLRAYADLKEKLDARPLVTSDEMEELKSIILSVDWEISDDTLERFDQMTTSLMTRLRFHKVFYPLLKIINSMGRYIASKKEGAHKDSISFLQTLFEHFEQVTLNTYMPFSEKKQLVEADIAAFTAFKKKISAPQPAQPAVQARPQSPVRPATQPVIQPEARSAEKIRPALSHVNAPEIRDAHTLVSLDTIPEVSETGAESTVTPLQEGMDRDVMGDLFNPKENEADRLMDQIHMSMVSGRPGAPPSLSTDNPEGFENLVPTRMDNEPIPEISNRLDHFFDLGTGAKAAQPESSPFIAFEEEIPSQPPEEPEEELLEDELLDEELFEEEFEAEEFDADGFTEEASLFEEEEEEKPEQLILFEADAPAPLPGHVPEVEKLTLFSPDEDPVQTAMKRLKAFLDSGASAEDRNRLAQAGEDLRVIKPVWQNDPEKSLLIDLASHLLMQLEAAQLSSGDSDEEIGQEIDQDIDHEIDPTPTPEPDTLTDPAEVPQDQETQRPKKFWPSFGGFKRKKDK